MSHESTEHPSAHGLQGTVARPRSPDEWRRAMEWAFEYRGDVTLELADRQSICGYVCNRVPDGSNSYFELLQPDRPDLLKIFCRDIRGIHFTGRDTASGQSWEAWVQKKRRDETR